MSYAGPAVPVGAPVPSAFNFNFHRTAVNVQIIYFSDVDGLVPLAGVGSATLTASHSALMWRGERATPGQINGTTPTDSTFNGAVIIAAVAREWQEFALGGGATSVVITPSALIFPPGAVTYSIVVDAEVRP